MYICVFFWNCLKKKIYLSQEECVEFTGERTIFYAHQTCALPASPPPIHSVCRRSVDVKVILCEVRQEKKYLCEN